MQKYFSLKVMVLVVVRILVLKGMPCFVSCAPRAQARLKTPRLGEAKPTIRGVHLGRLDVLHTLCAQCASLLGYASLFDK